jgi:thymidylate synthase
MNRLDTSNEEEYINAISNILNYGEKRYDRTGTGTSSIFGEMMKFDLSKGFPLLTTKKVHIKSVVHELLWFISGSTNIVDLQKHGVSIWDEWASTDGELGPVYGKQWRNWGKEGIDQLKEAIRLIREDRYSRRIIVSAWNPVDIPKMALPPCHMLYQFSVRSGNRLDCMLTQRSADMFLGMPFNIASYALLTHMVAHITGLTPGILTISVGDAHIYSNHYDQVREQISRPIKAPPILAIHGRHWDIDSFEFEDFDLVGYDPHPAIKGKVAV